MTRFILHGGFTSVPNELNRSFYRECSKGLSDGATLLLVYFAREDKDVPRLFEEDKRRILEQASTKDLNIVLAEQEHFIEQLRKVDAIYMRGGDTDKLLNTLKQFPNFKNALNGKIVSGSSAGAYVLAKYYHSASKSEVCEGLGILPIRVICHYQSDKFENRGNPIADMEEYPNNLELVVLKDCEWKSFEL